MKPGKQGLIKVFFDSTIFDLQIFGGISRYFTELVTTAERKKIFHPVLPLVISNNEYAKRAGLTKIKSNLHNVKIKGFKRLSWKLNSFVNAVFSNRRLRKGDFDIYHPTYYSKKSLRYSRSYKTVLTVYDMIHEKFPHLFDDAPDLIETKKQLIFNAAAIIAISENTKRDILHFYPGIEPSKISVTHLASSIVEYSEKQVALPFGKFIVFVGNRDGYKNFLPMLRAIIPALTKHDDLGLICVGGGGFKTDELNFLQSENLAGRVVQKNLGDEELKWIYTNSVALIFPSEYEGFGIPVIEAFECGCPVIVPALSSFPEIGEDAALFYEKTDLPVINVHLENLLGNEMFRKEVIAKSKQQAKKFSWEKMTLETLQVYQSILSPGND